MGAGSAGVYSLTAPARLSGPSAVLRRLHVSRINGRRRLRSLCSRRTDPNFDEVRVPIAAIYDDNPVPVDEGWAPRPNVECAYASHKLEAERLCAEAAPTAALRICSVLGPHADPLVRRATAGLRRLVPAARGRRQAVQFLHEADAAAAVLAAVHSPAEGVFNVAPQDWLDEHAVATVTGGRVVRLPLGLLVRGSNVAARLRLLGFGADRAIFLNGPLALDASRAEADLAWKAQQASAEVLSGFLSSA